MNARFRVGDHVLYVLAKGNGRPCARFIPAVVIGVTEQRVIIKCDEYPRKRTVQAFSLTKDKDGLAAVLAIGEK